MAACELSAVYVQAPVGTDFPFDIDLIERVEFVPGPSAAVYGANAFFGVLNIIGTIAILKFFRHGDLAHDAGEDDA